jgi:hypothetical protein
MVLSSVADDSERLGNLMAALCLAALDLDYSAASVSASISSVAK